MAMSAMFVASIAILYLCIDITAITALFTTASLHSNPPLVYKARAAIIAITADIAGYSKV